MTLRSVVFFFAHPDDETLAAGITALMTRQGIRVHFVCATRGEGGEMGDPPVVSDRRKLGEVRAAEMRCSAAALGASLEFLDYVDPVVGPDDVLLPFECDFDTLAGELVTIARQRNADLVLTHGSDGEYGHPAHQLLYQAVTTVFPTALPKTLIYTVAASVPDLEDLLWNRSEPAHLALDIRPWREAKLAAIECHASQHAVFKRHRNVQSVSETLRHIESVRRFWPPVDDEPPRDAFADLLRMAGAWEPGLTR
ncbi:MAG: PIG-L deacetylase family protein [Chloroflexota bacterium]|nr:MAG: hypothetical protein DIU68_03920 [Chloroflexota bacterium]